MGYSIDGLNDDAVGEVVVVEELLGVVIGSDVEADVGLLSNKRLMKGLTVGNIINCDISQTI